MNKTELLRRTHAIRVAQISLAASPRRAVAASATTQQFAKLWLGVHCVARDHSTHHVVTHMTMEQPNAGVIGHHIYRFHLSR